jgi:heat-inducible transcriptional repressor
VGIISHVSELKDLLGVLEEKERLMDVIETQTAPTSDGIHVYIGTENSSDAMKNTTLIFKDVFVGGKKLSVGVIGPKRMNYSKVIDMINRLAFGIDHMFNEEPGLPEPKDKY